MADNGSQNKLKLLFVQPTRIMDDGSLWKSKMPWLPRMALAQLAALTPDDIETTIIDEYIENIDFAVAADLIAISATTIEAPRAYQIAARFRKQGKKTIMGGIHASLVPEEARQFVDSVVIGEAEGIWDEVLADFKKGVLKRQYRNPGKADITHLPSPQLNKLALDNYWMNIKPVQTTRGCPHNCSFCAVTQFFGKSYRHRAIEEVVQEIGPTHSGDIFFVDDNIGANPKRAKELLKALIPLKIDWISQCCMDMAYDDEFLALAKESGCSCLIIGFESLSEQSLKSAHKYTNKVDDYFYVAEKLHKHEIHILASMVFGFDYDDETVFEKTARFMDDARIDFPCYWILTPYPNTPLYKQLDAAGRIIHTEWSKYDCTHAVFQPRLMSPKVLEEGYHYAFRKSYSLKSIMKRLMPSSFGMAKCLVEGLPQLVGRNYLFRRAALRAILRCLAVS